MRKQTLETIKKIWSDDRIGTHYEGCWKSHKFCVIAKLIAEVERMKIELDKRGKTIKSYQKLKVE